VDPEQGRPPAPVGWPRCPPAPERPGPGVAPTWPDKGVKAAVLAGGVEVADHDGREVAAGTRLNRGRLALGSSTDLGQLGAPRPHLGATERAPRVDDQESEGPRPWSRDHTVELRVALARPGFDVVQGYPAEQREPPGAGIGV